jgi:hypothetical protein
MRTSASALVPLLRLQLHFQFYTWIATTVIAYSLALVLSLMFEAPVMNLEKMIFDRAPPPASAEQTPPVKKRVENNAN